MADVVGGVLDRWQNLNDSINICNYMNRRLFMVLGTYLSK